jgi:hypothetical protein
MTLFLLQGSDETVDDFEKYSDAVIKCKAKLSDAEKFLKNTLVRLMTHI